MAAEGGRGGLLKFIIGIGNPGKKYEKTRHNVGYRVVELLGGKAGWRKDGKLKALRAPLGEDAVLVKPETFVNRTGEAVPAQKDVLLVCDDVNLAFGALRLRASGSAGGHHGLESVIEALRSEEFPRLRIGVRNERMPKDLTGFVLEEFGAQERKALPEILKKAALICETWAKSGFDAARDALSRLQSVKP